MIDKDIERRRYDNRAKFRLNANKLNHINKIPKYLNIPYKHYFKLLEGLHDQPKLLEIGAGMGENTGLLLDMQFEITSTDISQKSVEVMRGMFSDNADFSAEVADMEKLPFNNLG